MKIAENPSEFAKSSELLAHMGEQILPKKEVFQKPLLSKKSTHFF